MLRRFAIIIGAMKCGTTYLYDLLAQHPELCACRIKEPGYFSDMNLHNNPDVLPSLEKYQSLFPVQDVEGVRFGLEGSVDYTKTPVFPCAAKHMIKYRDVEYRFIYLVRNPLELLDSHYRHGLRSGFIKRARGNVVQKHALDISAYAMQLEEYKNLFGIESILVLDFNELTSSPLSVLRKIEQFLGLSRCDGYLMHAANRNASQSLLKFYPWVHALRRAIPIKGSFSLYAPSFFKKALRIEDLTRYALTSEQQEYALSYLRNDILKFGRVYRFDIDSWGLKLDFGHFGGLPGR